MDAADKLVNNRQPRRIILIFLLMLICSFGIFWVISAKTADRIVTGQIKASLAAASGSSKFTEIPDEQSIADGEAIYSSYGISADMNPRLMENWSGVRLMIFFPSAAVCALVCIIWLIISMRSLFGFYDCLTDISEQCVKLSEIEGFTVAPRGETFGCIRRVYEGIELISKRLRWQSSRLSAEKSFLGEFLTDFSHQMKTSIAIIRLDSDIIAETELSAQRLEQLSGEISDNVTAMEALTSSALKLAKLNAGAIEYKMEQSNLTEICKAAAKRITPLLRQNNITLTIKDSGERIVMRHDKIWLGEAVENIIKNAADHSGCTEITVEVSRTPTNTYITIEDNGKGIPQEDIPHLFERFGKRSSSTSMSSVGIGMAIAKRITEENGGEILVYSGSGSGTRFVMTFF